MIIKAKPPLTFKEAVIECFKKIIKFSGRSRRSEYWNYFLFFLIYIIVFHIMMYWSKGNANVIIIQSFLLTFTFIALISVSIRRFHDVGKSEIQLIVLGFIPIIGQINFIKLLLQDSEKKRNKYGYSPKYYEVFDNSVNNNNDQLGQMNMLQPIDPQIDPNMNPSELMQINDVQMGQIPQGISMSIPLNLSNMHILNQPQQMPPLVQNENYEPGVYQNNF